MNNFQTKTHRQINQEVTTVVVVVVVVVVVDMAVAQVLL